jgi:RNA polymerase sigma-70 factor (ECF subfamily)
MTSSEDAFHDELQRHRPYLLRQALFQLRSPERAEDVVQETLLAALEQYDQYAGKSSLRTWLTGILKHKIIDALRRTAREQSVGDLVDTDETGENEFDVLFSADGRWKERPSDWGAPERAYESQEFWRVFVRCSEVMPANLARAFAMREVLEMSTEEICNELAITPTNCNVMLYRARMRLRQCLDKNWFGGRN